MQNRASLAFALFLLIGCSSDPLTTVSIPAGFPGLTLAAEDLVASLNARLGSEDAEIGVPSDDGIRIVLDEEDIEGDQYRFERRNQGLWIRARTERGAMNGVYDLIDRIGTKYIHPEETVQPVADPDAPFPTLPSEAQVPRFSKRGFHEHTQHPLPATEFLLVPSDENRQMASRYIRWLSRNQQTQFSFMLLRTVDLEAWIPHMKSIVAEAHLHGIDVGLVLGFVDEQQNSFRLVRNDEGKSPGVQIQERLTRVLESDLDFLTFQIGASEFTKPDERLMRSWLEITRVHLQQNHPDVTAHTWIHITCNVLADDGSLYFHLPEKSDPFFGAWVHTTMYYDLENPAPVYECENFNHQLDFINRAIDNGDTRELSYFPETAWWLGFDNNVPLALPLTGWSRSWDIHRILRGDRERVDSHVTFTSGREWLYWQYDHYVAQAAWKGGYTWQDYVDDLAPLYGGSGEEATKVISKWASVQARYFYNINPDLYFYVAGELPQDEVGEQLGIFARRPKLSFSEVLNYTDEELAAWTESDLTPLVRMLEEHQLLLDQLPTETIGTPQQQALYAELRDTYSLYVSRINHALALYSGVVAAREWAQESQKDDPDSEIRSTAMASAMNWLSTAREVSQTAKNVITKGEERYRYPTELLAGSQPDNLSIYKFGHLADTRSALFWTRRDNQLETTIRLAFDESNDAWSTPPQDLYFGSKQGIRVTTPNNPLAAGALKGFLPSILVGIDSLSEGTAEIRLAQDSNANLKPDLRLDNTNSTESVVTGDFSEGIFVSEPFEYAVVVRESSGEPIEELILSGTLLTIETSDSLADSMRLEASFASSVLVELIERFTGTDPVAAGNLIKQVYGLPEGDPLPEQLPLALNLSLERVL